MPAYDECCILIPASTLEDFPSDATDADARSLLAAWTVLWHPELIAKSEQTPAWYRADGPPEIDTGHRVMAVPNSSFSMLPDGFEQKCRDADGVVWVTGDTRQAMLQSLGYDADPAEPAAASLQAEHRDISIDDFFALGYAMLQVQVMTRRLRYTSNLDEVYFQSCVVRAAQSFVQGDAETAVASMHDAFDALAQERDHYFSSDPHLIDLTLLSQSTLDCFFESLASIGVRVDPLGQQTDADPDSAGKDSAGENGVLATPVNVLIDAAMAAEIQKLGETKLALLRDRFSQKRLGWAGGGPSGDVGLATQTYTGAERLLVDAFEQTTLALGVRPPVYARYSGSTPADMTKVIAALDVAGMISIDFENGTGFGDEAKVVQKHGGGELHTLAAKPIDASSSTPFLALGSRLGEAIDSGEIATALLVHWPGHQGDTLNDIRRTASWSLVLGRFWTLEDFFRTGEQPYHHNADHAAASRADVELTASVERGDANPLSSLADQVTASIEMQNETQMRAMICLASGQAAVGEDLNADLLRALGLTRSENPSNVAIINPMPCPQRCNVEILGSPHHDKHVYAASGSGNQSVVTTDVSAFGFSVVRNEATGTASGRSLGRRMRDLWSAGGWLGGGKPMVVDSILQNAFMEVGIDPESGGIKGAYSGGARGNRFSMRLVCVAPSGDRKTKLDSSANASVMKCDKIKTLVSRMDLGEIQTTGSIFSAGGDKVASYELTYRLERGSRFVQVHGQFDALTRFSEDPWQHYLAARSAVAADAVIPKLIVRDKLHKATSRRMVAPLGVVLDEAERQTLIATAGRAYHRRVGDRFFDTLLCVRGETRNEFTLHYGFEVPDPVGAARSVLVDPIVTPVEPVDLQAARGWLIHVAPAEVLVADVKVAADDSGRLFAVVRLIQTRSRGCTASLRFCRSVEHAVKRDDIVNQPVSRWRELLSEAAEASPLLLDSDRVQIPMGSHEVVDLVIGFKGGG
ncbi:hypothetical protein [Novipirellula artificiosorum]|uniref:Uncharacterized protein n=1 Tax=Novipirellula artificiosorum TaxID=2528016 RepID=A0A5C6D4M4_9BACT|nr:hypothetical protein [Novipirellula artificiosorum]TWU31015.1 hypothetical protein Poly41_64840 [Novipirellula artificiosorum]